MNSENNGQAVWSIDTNKGKVLRALIVSCNTYEDIRKIINNTFGTEYTTNAIKSAAHRHGLFISEKEKISEKQETYKEKFNIQTWDSVPTYVIEDDREWVPISPFGDLHVGNYNYLEEVFDKYIDYWNEINAHTFSVGDLSETVTLQSIPGAIWDQVMSPGEQVKYLRERILKIKNYFAMAPGNHEGRIIRASNIDPLEHIADLKEALYMRHGGLINVVVGEVEYLIMFKHGKSFAKNFRKEIEDFGLLYPEADIICLGHKHVNEVFRVNECFGVTSNNGKLERTSKFQVGVRTGHALGYGGYLEERPFKPHDPGFPILWLNSKTKSIYWDDTNKFVTKVEFKED